MSKLLKGSITMLVGEITRFEFKDSNSGVTIARVELTPDQVCAMLSRQLAVECEYEHGSLDRVGKALECKTFDFMMPDTQPYSYDKKTAIKRVKKQCPEDWVPDLSFSSQNSFFTDEYGQHRARCVIRRWV